MQYNGLVAGPNCEHWGRNVKDTGRDGELHITATDLLGHTEEEAKYVPMLPQRDVEGVRHPRAQPHKGGQLTACQHDLGVFARIPLLRKFSHQLGDFARLNPHLVAHTVLLQEGSRPGADLCAQAQKILLIGGQGNLAACILDVVQIRGTPLCTHQVKLYGLNKTVRVV